MKKNVTLLFSDGKTADITNEFWHCYETGEWGLYQLYESVKRTTGAIHIKFGWGDIHEENQRDL
jgi:hypothetical protein